MLHLEYLVLLMMLLGGVGQIFYTGFFFRKLASSSLYNANEKLPDNQQPSLSVVICAYNELENLQELLPILLAQSYACYEIVIVDDRSNDGSWVWLQEQSFLYENLQVKKIFKTPKGWNPKKYALVQGVKQAKNDIILLTDADCRPNSPYWIKLMAQSFNRPGIEIVLGFSPYFKSGGALNCFIQYETFFTALQYLSFALVGKTYMGVGRNLAYRRELFENGRILEKHKSVTGGDDDLLVNETATATNTNICIHPDAHMKSIPKTTWRSWYRQKTRHLAVGKLYKPKHHVLLGTLLFTQTLVWVSLFLGSIFRLYVHHVLIFEVIIFLFSLRMLVLLSIYKVIIHKLRIDVKMSWIPILDLLYIFYIFIIGSLAISRKRLKWT